MESTLIDLLDHNSKHVRTFDALTVIEPEAATFVRQMRSVRNEAIKANECFHHPYDPGMIRRDDVVASMMKKWNFCSDGEGSTIAYIRYLIVFLEIGRLELLDCPCARCVTKSKRCGGHHAPDRERAAQRERAKKSVRKNSAPRRFRNINLKPLRKESP